LTFKSPQVLRKHAEEILEWTFGVFGEVNALFTRANMFARQESRTAIKWTDIVKAKYTAAQMERLRFEIEVGEHRVRGEVHKAPATSSEHRSRRPGARNPVRDRRGQQT